jgi:hypothetical protein
MGPERNDAIANHLAEIETLRQTAQRLERAGLIVDSGSFSPAHRRAFFAWQCRAAGSEHRPAASPPRIGFAYPNAR